MGKFGREIGKPVFERLKKQTKEEKPTYVFLTTLSDKGYIVHAGVLEDLAWSVDKKQLIPSYYANQQHRIKSWFKISRFLKLDKKVLEKLEGRSSRLPIAFSLKASMAGAMSVTLKESVNIEDFYCS